MEETEGISIAMMELFSASPIDYNKLPTPLPTGISYELPLFPLYLEEASSLEVCL